MIKFLESVIIHSLYNPNNDPGTTVANTPLLLNDLESDADFTRKLFHNSNSIARTKQLHSKQYIVTYFKYRP
jgi:hypothetical protein